MMFQKFLRLCCLGLILQVFFHSSLFGYNMVTNSDFHPETGGNESMQIEDRAIYSHPAGFYDAPFVLTIAPPEGAHSIRYTLDGSNPATSSKAYESRGSVEIYIHPDSVSGRAKTPGFVVRTVVMLDEATPSFPRSQTYLFIDKVREQTYPGSGWPENAVNNQVLDYELAQDVLNDPRYRDSIEIALMDLPSLCLATDNEHLFDPASGIFVNPGKRGREWEREVSVELLYPDQQPGFQVNAGLRIRGGSSRDKQNPKHSFRLLFRSEYGDAKLHYPLFGTEGAAVFDKMDLRTAQNYSWNADAEENHLNTLVRDVFSRDLQREIGQPYTRSRYYHLYLNGMYWGIFQTQERAEARYASTYFHDPRENYDVIKVNPQTYPYETEVTDGNDEAWKEIYELCQAGFDDNADYFHLEGKNANGDPVPGKKVLVDIDNMIDYLLIIFYTGNFDAPVSAFGGNDMPNNFYAIYNREDNNKGFMFFLHDSEHSLMIDPVYAGEGLYEDRVNIAERNDWFRMEMNSFKQFHPQWIHHRLSHLPEYRQRFADRAYRVFRPDGIFTPEKARALFEARMKEVETAIIAESARWGDARHPVSRTKDDDWVPQINMIRNTFFPKRTDIVIEQLKEAGLYTELPPPRTTVEGEVSYEERVYFQSSLQVVLSNPAGYGDLYYTLDGTDPRLVGGEIAENAIKAESGENFDLEMQFTGSAVLKARLKSGDDWSAIRQFSALKESEDYSFLKITELNYHPLNEITTNDTIDGDEFEFVEFKNTGTDAINLSGLRVGSAINYAFPANQLLPPGGFFVIAGKPADFYNRYGMHASGNFSKNLSNSGEHVVLSDPDDNVVLEFTYSDDAPWPTEPGGEGYTLVAADLSAEGDPNDPSYWRKSRSLHGSPFKDDVNDNPNAVFDPENQDVEIYPNPTKGPVWLDWSQSGVEGSEVQVEIIDVTGRLFMAKSFAPEPGEAFVNLEDLTDGIYVLRLSSGNFSISQRIIILP